MDKWEVSIFHLLVEEKIIIFSAVNSFFSERQKANNRTQTTRDSVAYSMMDPIPNSIFLSEVAVDVIIILKSTLDFPQIPNSKGKKDRRHQKTRRVRMMTT